MLLLYCGGRGGEQAAEYSRGVLKGQRPRLKDGWPRFSAQLGHVIMGNLCEAPFARFRNGGGAPAPLPAWEILTGEGPCVHVANREALCTRSLLGKAGGWKGQRRRGSGRGDVCWGSRGGDRGRRLEQKISGRAPRIAVRGLWIETKQLEGT